MTSLNCTAPRTGRRGSASGFSATSGLESSTSSTRSAPARGLLALRDQARHHAYRRSELDEVRGEREERAEAQVAVDRHPTAEADDGSLRERRDRLERRLVARLESHDAHPAAELLAAAPGELLELALLLAERLDHAHARHCLFDDTGDVGLTLLRVPVGGEQLHPQRGREAEQGRDAEQRDERERWREEQHGDDGDHHQHEVAERDRELREEALEQADVGSCPRHELTGLHVVVRGEVEALQPLEDRVAQVVLHVEADALAGEAPPVPADEADDAEPHHQREPGPQRLGVGDQHVVDEHGLDQRRQRRDPLPDHREPERQDRVALVRQQVRQQAPDPSTTAGRCWLDVAHGRGPAGHSR